MRRILLTNNHLVQPGGSETWTLTVATELVRRGYDCSVYAIEIGPFADAFPCPVTREVEGHFDLGLVNHNSCIPAARAACRTVIMTCHGTYPPLEQPVLGADRYVAVSEEVQAHLERQDFSATIIRNPIDCALFAPAAPVAAQVRRVLSLCQGVRANELLASLCEREGWTLRTIDDGNRALGIEKLINEADLVVGLGRSAMEAMACGRPVLVFDSRSYTPYAMDGMVTPDNIDDLVECNLSGRRYRLEATLDSVAEQIGLYRPALGEFGRRYARANLDVRRQVDAYLDLAEMAGGGHRRRIHLAVLAVVCLAVLAAGIAVQIATGAFDFAR